MIDTSQAQEGTTYRFVLAYGDSARPDKGFWEGPTTIDFYPTLGTRNCDVTHYRVVRTN